MQATSVDDIVRSATTMVRDFDSSVSGAMRLIGSGDTRSARQVLREAARSWRHSLSSLPLPMGKEIPDLWPGVDQAATNLVKGVDALFASNDPIGSEAELVTALSVQKRIARSTTSLHRFADLQTFGFVRSRLVKEALSHNPQAVFAYVGDTVTQDQARAACTVLMRRSAETPLSAQDIIDLTPNRPGDAVFWGGGWGCHHLWVPLG